MLNEINAGDTSELRKFLAEFQKQESSLINEPTIFEIAGFPSRENVFSNFLKFYFDSRNPHGFGSKILRALFLNVPDIDLDDKYLSTKSIKREVTTNTLKRLDLVIETSSYIIGIENKVYHILNNDLADYSKHLDDHYSVPIYKFVLNLTEDNKECDENGFRFISYKTFLRNLEDTVPAVNSDNRYHLFYNEFIQNIKNHFPDMMTKDQIQFIVAHEGNIEKIKELSNRSVNYINSRVAEISKLIAYDELEWERYSEVAYSFEVHSKSAWPFIRIACTVEISKIYIEVTSDKELLALKVFLNTKLDSNLDTNREWIYVRELGPLYEVKNGVVATHFVNILLLGKNL